MEYPSKELAEAALIVLNGFQLDKNHVFRAYHFPMLDDLKEPDANWSEPKPKEYIDVVCFSKSLFFYLLEFRVICGGTSKIPNLSISLQSKCKIAKMVNVQQLFIGPTPEKTRRLLKQNRCVISSRFAIIIRILELV